jgi:CheY-like chemotaxis protein
VVGNSVDDASCALARVLAAHDVESAPDAFAAIHRLEEADRPFDVILCDVTTEKLPGPELWAYLSVDSGHLAERIVFIGARALPAQTAAFLERVPNPYVDLRTGTDALAAILAMRASPTPDGATLGREKGHDAGSGPGLRSASCPPLPHATTPGDDASLHEDPTWRAVRQQAAVVRTLVAQVERLLPAADAGGLRASWPTSSHGSDARCWRPLRLSRDPASGLRRAVRSRSPRSTSPSPRDEARTRRPASRVPTRRAGGEAFSPVGHVPATRARKTTRRTPVTLARDAVSPVDASPHTPQGWPMATKKDSLPTRGKQLVKKALEVALARGVIPSPEPLSPSLVRKLKLPNGEPLSPAMKELLTADGSWIGLDYDEDEGEIEGTLLEDVIEEAFGEEAVPAFGEATELLSEDCVAFGAELSRPACLYVGATNDAGEYPVIQLRWEDGVAEVGGFVPFDVWLAQELGAVERGKALGDVPPEYAELGKELADSNGDGRVVFVSKAGEVSAEDDEDDEEDESA